MKKHLITEEKNIPRAPLIASSPLRFTHSPLDFVSDTDSQAEETKFVDIDMNDEVTGPPLPKDVNLLIDEIIAREEQNDNGNPSPPPAENQRLLSLNNPAGTAPDKCLIFKNAAISTLTGTGVGLGMMPIFNYYLKKSPLFGFDLHGNEIIFAISTANTFIIYGFNSGHAMYQFLSNNHQELNKLSTGKMAITAAKIGASCSAVFPLALLWHIEVTNQKVSGSQGFDQFVAWASVATIPLFADSVLSSCNAVDYINSIQNKELNSIGSKAFTYGISLIGSGSRLASYSSIGYLLGQDIGLPPVESIILGIICAGVAGSVGVNLFQYQKIKSFFTENNAPMTIKKGVVGTIAVLEGTWLSFPLLSVGLELMKDVNVGITTAALGPMFVSNLISESERSYQSITSGCDWLTEKCYGLLGNNDENYHTDLDS